MSSSRAAGGGGGILLHLLSGLQRKSLGTIFAPWTGLQRKSPAVMVGHLCRRSSDNPIQEWDNRRTTGTFSWTALISHYSKCGQGRQALRIYWEMRERGVRPSSYTCVVVLKACSSIKDLRSAKQIHAEVVDSGFESDLYVGTMLVDVYAKCGSLADARGVFEKMFYRDVVSWNAMILGHSQMEQGEEALLFYARMQKEGVTPNDRTFVAALRACSSLAAVEEGKEGAEMIVKKRCLEQVRAINTSIVESGCESDVFVGTMLVDAYGKCGSLVDARGVFEKMPVRNAVSWNAMILGYAQMEEGEMALQLYAQMQQESVSPNERTFVATLKACSSLAAFEESSRSDGTRIKQLCLERVRAIHTHILQKRSESDVYVGTMLVDVYGKCGSLGDARHVFEKMPHRNVVTWNAMILGYAQMDEGIEALQLYAQMQQEGLVADDRTFVGALRACSGLATSEEGHDTHAKNQCFEYVQAIHRHVVKSGCEADVFVATMLVEVYAKCGMMMDARRLFEKMAHHNVVSWTAMILGYAQTGEAEEALQLYARMQQEGVLPDERTFVGVLKACSCLAASEKGNQPDGIAVKTRSLKEVRRIHSDVVSSGCDSDVFVGTMLVDVYAKCGSLVDARDVFEKIPHPDVASWNAMITGYGQTEMSHEALQLYSQMQDKGEVPNDRTFVGALKACGTLAGLEKGKEIHNWILQTGLQRDPFVATSLIDMYAKCGSMVNAQQVFDGLPTRDIVTWSALISGYAFQGESDLVFDLLQRMREAGLKPDGITMLSILSVCSHVGLVDKGQKYFTAMSRDYGITPTTDHYTCMVDLLGRAGQVHKAMALAKGMPSQPDIAVWQTVLGACQKWCNVELGREAFENAVMLDKNDAAAYVLMSNIYEAAHMMEDAKRIQEMKHNLRAWKKPGQSWWTDTSGVIHAFIVGDRDNLRSQNVHLKLHDLHVKMQEELYIYLT